MQVSVIIVNYKTPQLCIDCINSVFEKTSDLDYEIIVVDNQSQDGSIEKLNGAFGDKIKLIESQDNLGFGRANNLGARSASGEYLFLLNSDTLLKNNAIKILFDFASASSTIGIVGGNLFSKEGELIHSFKKDKFGLRDLKVVGFFKSLLHRLFHVSSGKDYNTTGAPLCIDGYITGADLMISRSLFQQVGGFDEDFFMYFEENEMTNRVHEAGYEVYSVPAAEIIHLEGASTGKNKISARRQRMLHQSAILFFRKVYGEETLIDCYKILISNCKKVIFRKRLQFDYEAVKALKEEKSILLQEYKNYKSERKN